MGNSSENQSLEDIGKKANQQSPSSFISSSSINLNNSTLVSLNNNDPENDYKKINQIGEGQFGSVFEVKNRITEMVRAMKTVKKHSGHDESEIINEAKILTSMDHPCIIKIFEFYSNEETYSIIMEYCKEGSLLKEIDKSGPFDESCTAYIMYQLFFAINYYNNMQIIHRDIKPENILIYNKNKETKYPNIKICDFGMSKIVEKNTFQKQVMGSLYYIAPEVLEKNYNEKCDLWSCGVIMYLLLTKKIPFDGAFNDEVIEKIKKGEYDKTPLEKYSSNCKDLLQKLLTIDVSKRIPVQECLNHPWIKEHNSKELYNKILDEGITLKFLNNLKKYKKSSILQETALAFLVHNFPQMKDVINASKLFNQIDTNDDGKITQEELYLGLKKRLKTDSLKDDVKNIFQSLDMNNDGFIEYEEFVRAAVSKEKFMGENVLKFGFRFFDKDNSGKITLNEIETVFKNSIDDKENMDKAFNKIISEVDIDNDGKISYEEFAKVMKKLIQ